MAGRENDRAVDAAQGGGNRRRGERGQTRGHARDHAERHARRRQRQGLLAAAPEHERIAALEPQHPAARRGQARSGACEMSAWVADGLPPRLPANSSRACGPASASTRLSTSASCTITSACDEAGERIERQQAGIARPGAGQPDMPGLQHRDAAALRRQCVPAVHRLRAPLVTAAAPAHYSKVMSPQARPLRRGWTTGTCATAAAKAAYAALLTGEFPDPVEVTLPRGERHVLGARRQPQGRDIGDRRRGQGCRRRSGRHPRRAGAGDRARRRARQRRQLPRRRGRRHGDPRRPRRSRPASRQSIRCRGG